MKHRGVTFVTVLVLAAVVGAIFWGFTYGEAYVENYEVNRVLREAANLCYRQSDDEYVKGFIVGEMHRLFDQKVDTYGKTETAMRVDFSPDDVRIERTQIPAFVNIWLTYTRTVRVPLVGKERQVTFTDHADADLTPVKW